VSLPLARAWELARRWYGDRLSPGWRPLSPARAQALLSSVGLDGPFWELVAPP
jgi:hypothetical protein